MQLSANVSVKSLYYSAMAGFLSFFLSALLFQNTNFQGNNIATIVVIAVILNLLFSFAHFKNKNDLKTSEKFTFIILFSLLSCLLSVVLAPIVLVFAFGLALGGHHSDFIFYGSIV